MIEESIANEKTAEAGAIKATVPVTSKTAGTCGIKTLVSKALVFMPAVPILAIGALAALVAWEFWKGSRDEKEMKKM